MSGSKKVEAESGDHTLFIGEVLAAYVNEGVFTQTINIKKVKLVYHMGGDDFATISPEAASPQPPQEIQLNGKSIHLGE